MICKCYYILLSCVISLVSISDGEELKLILVHGVYRHGLRSPIKTFPNDPYKDTIKWPDGWGNLTEHGRNQQYSLGQWIGKRYHELFPTKMYDSNEVFVQSTDVERTKISAQFNIIGFNNVIHPRNNIEIFTVPREKDEILYFWKTCPNYEVEFAKIVATNVKETNEKYTEMYSELQNQTGWNVTTVVGASETFDSLDVETKSNLTLPEWTQNFYPQPLKEIHNLDWSFMSWTNLTKRLFTAGGGPFIKMVIQNMNKKINDSLYPDYKLLLFSAHDFTLLTLLRTLDVKINDDVPDFSSAIFIELLQDIRNNYFVKILYKRSSTEDIPAILKIPGCSTLCSLEDFIDKTNHIIPTDWSEECTEGYNPVQRRLNVAHYRTIF